MVRTGLMAGLLLLVLSVVMPRAILAAPPLIANDEASLKAAITSANETPEADTILLTADIGLTNPSESVENYGDTGLPPVSSPITIEGQGFSISRSAGTFRIFRVATGGDLTLINLTVSGGEATGSAVCSFMPCGGAGYNDGTLTILHSTFSGNLASADFSSGGGAIYNNAVLNIVDSTFTGNTTQFGSGGGVFNVGVMTITDSVFTNNSAPIVFGGGVYHFGVGSLTILNSTFADNSAGNGGALGINSFNTTIRGSTFSDNTASSNGGALAISSGISTVVNSTFSGNTADSGGGLYNTAELSVYGSTFSGNVGSSANGGAAVYTDGDLASTNFFNTVIANSQATEGNDPYPNCAVMNAGVATAQSSQADDESCTGFDYIDPTAEPHISFGDLLDNGGSTGTFASGEASSTLNVGGAEVCHGDAIDSVDQRGVNRGETCDIGSYESDGSIHTVQFASSGGTAFGTEFPVKLILDAPLEAGAAPVTAYVWVSGGSAVANTDYAPFGLQTVTFNPGDLTASVTLHLLDVSLTVDKSIVLSIANTRGPGFSGPARLGTRQTYTAILRVSLPDAVPSRNFFDTSTPILTWTPINGALGYEIQVDTDLTFTAPHAIPDMTVGSTKLSVQTAPLPSGLYYWRVRPIIPIGVGSWSATDTFEVSG